MAKKSKTIVPVSSDEYVNDMDLSITEIIGKFKTTYKQEQSILEEESNNWAEKKSLVDQELFYEVEKIIVDMHVGYIKEIFLSLNGRTKEESPYSYKWMEILKKSFNIYDKRVQTFLNNENKTQTKISPKDIASLAKRLNFRKDVTKDHAKFKNIIKGITFDGDENSDIPFSLHAQTPVASLSFKYIIENKYPKMKSYLEERKNKTKDKKNGRKKTV